MSNLMNCLNLWKKLPSLVREVCLFLDDAAGCSRCTRRATRCSTMTSRKRPSPTWRPCAGSAGPSLLLGCVCCAFIYGCVILCLDDAHVRDCGMQGLNYIVATEADEKTKESVCKFAALHAFINCVIMWVRPRPLLCVYSVCPTTNTSLESLIELGSGRLVNKQPVSCGGPIVAPAMAVILGMNGF